MSVVLETTVGATTGVELVGTSIGYPSRRRRLRRRPHTVVAPDLQAVARPGELTALIGPNGAGKSTLLRTLCGLQPALDGRVLLDGRDMASFSAAELATRVAVVLTERLDPGLMTARELVALGRTPHLQALARLSATDRAVVEWAISTVGADHLADRQFIELSDGERQRTLTARALAQQPSLLVLDEPTSFLDVPSRVELIDMLRHLAHEQGLSVLMSTHELELALRVADRIWLLQPDGCLHDATPLDLAASGLIGETFDRGQMRFDAESLVFTVQQGART